MISADTLSRLTSQSVHFASPDAFEPLWDELVEYDLRVLEIDAGQVLTEQELLNALGDAAFDPAIKEGWGALAGYLVDGSRADASGIVVVVHGARDLWQSHPALAGALVEVWLAAAEAGREHDFAAHLVFELPEALSPLEPDGEAEPDTDVFIPLRPIDSTMFRAVGYDSRQRILEVEFLDRRVYRYYRVPARIYRNLLTADSSGLYFQDAIRDVYRYAKVSK